MKNKITVIGSINMDYTSVVPRLPEKGETILARKFKVSPGGKGANQAAAAARLGGQVQMIGAVGQDDAGNRLKKILMQEGIEVSAVKETQEPTGNALIAVEEFGKNMIVVFSGANAAVDERQIQGYETLVDEAEIVILQLEIPIASVLYAAKLAKSKSKTVILNPAPAAQLPEEIYACLDYITPNETELALLTGCEDIREAAQKLLDKGVKNVIVTLGEKGCLLLNEEGILELPAFKVNPKDTTAAGDTFNGAFAVAISEEKSLRDALRFASAAAGLSTEQLGAMESIPTRVAVDEFLSRHAE